jgi:cobyrinic acid a,c-diamide synthase
MILGPRVVIAGTHSGVGKTTVATGLMAALVGRGLRVASAKVGPDFIDPGYHAVATGRPGRNLDSWICGESAIPALAARAATGSDILIVEGVMGLFDGAADPAPDGALPTASTAEIAALLGSPVVLVVDASSMSGSVAALVHGFATLDRRIDHAGVILNRVGSDGHEVLLREALAPLGIAVLGVLRRDAAFAWRDRHLGLVPVVERRAEVARSVRRLSDAIVAGCDLDAVLKLAHTAAPMDIDAPLPPPADGTRSRVAVASGPAFSFSYPDNLEALRAAGAELLPFDPLEEAALPDGVDALVAGGGFPEVFASALAANEPLLADVAAKVGAGLTTWAECGGLLWLSRSLDGARLAGAIAADAVMTDRLSLGYRTATTTAPSPFGPAGTALRGHEFHYSEIEPAGDGLDLIGRFGGGRAGWLAPHLFASYLHLHLGAAPRLAERFVATTVRGCAGSSHSS